MESGGSLSHGTQYSVGPPSEEVTKDVLTMVIYFT